MDEVEIKGLRVRTEVGFSPHELGKRQDLIVTIVMRTSIKKAGESDQVEDTFNYKTITKDVIFHLENKRYNLIEAVATDVARICVVRHGVSSVKVIVHKPNALRFTKRSSVTIERSLRDFDWQQVHISMGSNIDPSKNLPHAISLLNDRVQLIKVSKAFKTTPVGYKEQEDFVNMAALLRTKLGPAGLKLVLGNIEHQVGRIRDPTNKNAPRTIDLDIAFWGDTITEYSLPIGSTKNTWTIPDPDTLTHAHVIVPLADVTPEFLHPLNKQSLQITARAVSGKEDFRSVFPTVRIHEATAFGSDILTEFDGGRNVISDGPQSEYRPVALVTGAARRIGSCIVRRLHSAGYNVMVHFKTSEKESALLIDELNRIRLNSARSLQEDLSVDTQKTTERIVHECLEAWRRLDVLVNNASLFYSTEIGQVQEKDWNELIQTNLCAAFFLSQAAYPSLKTSRGCIINILDVHAERPLVNHSVYCISKAGLSMCTQALAKEFAPHVRVNGVSPGAILWPDNKDQSKYNGIFEKIPMGRMGDPSDIAITVEFLARFAGYTTGQVLRVDGGRSLNQ